MIRKIVMFGMLITFLSTATFAMADEVFVTKNGSKYHKASCRLLKKKESAKKLDKDDAIEKGYTPCKRCFKEDVIVDESDEGAKKDKVSKKRTKKVSREEEKDEKEKNEEKEENEEE